MNASPLHKAPIETEAPSPDFAFKTRWPQPIKSTVAPARRNVRPHVAARRFFQTRLFGWTVIAVVVVTWQACATVGVISWPMLPAPRAILIRWSNAFLSGELPVALGSTLTLMLTGYVLSCAVGVLIGVLMARFRTAYGLLEPFIELFRPVPITAIVPLLVLFLGIGDQLKIVAVFIAALFPNILNSYAGIRSVPRTLRETALTFGLPKYRAIRQIFIPCALPQIFVGMRTALGISLIVTVFSEMISGNTGMGYFIFNSQQTLNIVDLYVGVFTLAVVGYLLNLGVLAAERTILPWQIGSARRPTA